MKENQKPKKQEEDRGFLIYFNELPELDKLKIREYTRDLHALRGRPQAQEAAPPPQIIPFPRRA